MSTNKKAVIRYMYLDQLLSDRHYEYTCRELVEKMADKMGEDFWDGNPDTLPSAKRLIQMDLQDLQNSPFFMEIDSSRKRGTAPVYHYKDPTHTLFSKQLTDDEKLLLREVLNTLGQFAGVDSFEWLDDLRERLRDKRAFGNTSPIIQDCNNAMRKIMSFEENRYLRNKEYLPKLFSCIANRQTICVHYKKFNDSEINHYNVYPYMLKQYSTRWYLLCTPAAWKEYSYNPELILSLPIDRFEGEVTVCNGIPFIECAVDLDSRFEEIIGVTYYTDNPVERIILAVRDDVFPYIDTKPLHETQKRCIDPLYQMTGYTTISIECRYNYELLSKIYSFGDGIIVLAPQSLKKTIIERIEKQRILYGLR